MFEANNLMQLFPTPLWVHAIAKEDYDALNEAVIGQVDRLMAGSSDTSTRGQWRSQPNLHELEDMAALKYYIDAAVDQTLGFLRLQATEFSVKSCWAEVTAPGGPPTATSAQANSYLTGLYMAQGKEGANIVHAFDPRPQTEVLLPAVAERNAYNTRRTIVTIEEGTLVLFPSWLPVSVPANQSGERRVLFAFNAMLEHLS